MADTKWQFRNVEFQSEGAILRGEELAIAGWQIKRDGTYRGIIEIVEEQT
jgi:hypothetical protein